MSMNAPNAGSAALPAASSPAGENVLVAYGTRDRTLLAVGAIASYWIFSLVGSAVGVPEIPGYAASLLAQPSPVVALVVTAIVLVACVLLSTLVAVGSPGTELEFAL